MIDLVLKAENITKVFPGVVALQNVDISMHRGRIHCLVGENGAGKSTLIKIFAGQFPQDDGNLYLSGEVVKLTNPTDARNKGISVIHQELQLVPFLTVAENVALGRWPANGGFINKRKMMDMAVANIEKLGAHIDPDKKVYELSTAQQQLVEVARALSIDARILIMDEPTASLSEKETVVLFRIIKNMRDQGMSILYVSHRLEEVFEIADTISVLRDGKMVGTKNVNEIEPNEVVKMMVGRETTLYSEKRHKPEENILEIRHLSRYGVLDDISLYVRKGEIVGLGGLVGAGRTELARCIFGIDQFDEGEILFDGVEVNVDSPRRAIDLGMGFVPEDRKTQGLILVLTVKNNVAISSLDRLNTFGWVQKKLENEIVLKYKEMLNIRTQSVNSIVSSLSGGNQQKVVIARCLARQPRLMILDEPTRGVDIGAKGEIHHIIEKLVESGIGIMLISSELPELITMCDRVYVMRNRRILQELRGDEITKDSVMSYAAGMMRTNITNEYKNS